MNDCELSQILLSHPPRNLIVYGRDPKMFQRVCRILDIKDIKTYTDNKLDIRTCENHYLLNMSQITRDNINTFKTHYRDLTRYKTTYKKIRRYILLTNFESCKPSIQDYLRVPMESTTNHVNHILLTCHISKVHKALMSRSLCIRLTSSLSMSMDRSFKTPPQILVDRLMEIYVHDFSPFTPTIFRDLKDIAKTIL